MKKSENINELAAALAKAQAKIESATKSAKNPFYKSNYADLPAVWASCREHLTGNGLSIAQLTDTGENGILLETVLMHSSGQWISSLYPVNPLPDKEGRETPQALGSAITYARRYALMALVGIVADFEDDDGEKAMGREVYSQPHVPNAQQRGIHTPLKAPEAPPAADHTKAASWAMDAIAAIRRASVADLAAWKRLNAKAMEKLLATEPDLYTDVTDNMSAREAVLKEIA